MLSEPNAKLGTLRSKTLSFPLFGSLMLDCCFFILIKKILYNFERLLFIYRFIVDYCD